MLDIYEFFAVFVSFSLKVILNSRDVKYQLILRRKQEKIGKSYYRLGNLLKGKKSLIILAKKKKYILQKRLLLPSMELLTCLYSNYKFYLSS